MSEETSSSDSVAALPDGLGSLHLAVLKDDYSQVRTLLKSGEVGVDQRTAIGTTPLMLSALYGRTAIYMYLVNKAVRLNKEDRQGQTALDYAASKSPFLHSLISKYHNITEGQPRRIGRRFIYRDLKSRLQVRSKAYAEGFADGRVRQEAPQVPAQLPQPLQDAPLEKEEPHRISETVFLPSSPPLQHVRLEEQSRHLSENVFLRSLDGKQQDLVEIRPVAHVNVDISLGRKSTGIVRGKDEGGIHAFAFSGWSGIRGQGSCVLLDNKQYTGLVRRICAMYGFELKRCWFDITFPGDSDVEKYGAFFACHVEKQLGVFVLLKSLFHILGDTAITIESIGEVLNKVHDLPPELRETVIELDHKPCSSCLDFLDLLRQKAGLVISILQRSWYTYGLRKELRRQPDGMYKPITRTTRLAGGEADADIIEDDIDAYEVGRTIEDAPRVHFPEHGEVSDEMDLDEVTIVQDNNIAIPTTPLHRRPVSQTASEEPGNYWRRASPVKEEPVWHTFRYKKFDLTPPSQLAQALPTPQAAIPPSPSPAGLFHEAGPIATEDGLSRESSTAREYEVEKILDSKEEAGSRFYLVKWRGYPKSDDYWEPADNLSNSRELIKKFWLGNQRPSLPNEGPATQ